MKQNDVFVSHIKYHLSQIGDGTGAVCCKICGKTIGEIFDDYKHKMMYSRGRRAQRFKLELKK